MMWALQTTLQTAEENQHRHSAASSGDWNTRTDAVIHSPSSSMWFSGSALLIVASGGTHSTLCLLNNNVCNAESTLRMH